MSESPPERDPDVQVQLSPPAIQIGPPPALAVNAALVRIGPFDVTLDLGFRAGASDEQQHVVRVVMSYEHAQAFAKLLQRQIDAYVEQAGALPDLDRLKQEEESVS